MPPLRYHEVAPKVTLFPYGGIFADGAKYLHMEGFFAVFRGD